MTTFKMMQSLKNRLVDKMTKDMNRRDMIKGSLKYSAAAAGASLLGSKGIAQGTEEAKRKYIFVVAAGGGANILDSFLAQTTGPNGFQANDLKRVNGSAFSGVNALRNQIQGVIPLGNGYDQGTFIQKHGSDAIVITNEVSSVTHSVASVRAITGDNVNAGRTITEAVALQYGGGSIIPNLNMAGEGYAANGIDRSIPAAARAEIVSDPALFALATHGFKGVEGAMPAGDMAMARKLRLELEQASRFGKKYTDSKLYGNYLHNREKIMRSMEKGDIVTKLSLPSGQQFNFALNGDATKIAEKLPKLAFDPLQSQVALAFLAAKSGFSNAITISTAPSPIFREGRTDNAPIGFDWSHLDHRGGQNAMWSYILANVDALIELLKEEDIDGDPSKGKMWDQSLIYIATEFGRDRTKGGGSGHHLNNGNILISPMFKGNAVYGGVDPQTNLTYGFNPVSGEPDKNSQMKEKHVYSAICHALGIDFAGRIDMPCLVRGA